MIDACVDGKQIALGRIKMIDRAIAIILAKSEHLDWDKHDLLIQVVPSKDKAQEGA